MYKKRGRKYSAMRKLRKHWFSWGIVGSERESLIGNETGEKVCVEWRSMFDPYLFPTVFGTWRKNNYFINSVQQKPRCSPSESFTFSDRLNFDPWPIFYYWTDHEHLLPHSMPCRNAHFKTKLVEICGVHT